MSLLTRIDQKFGSFDLSIRWNCKPGAAGFICKSKTVSFTAFCSRAESRLNADWKLSAMQNLI
jgi:hypothetical protein